MCTYITKKVAVRGAGKGQNGWMRLEQANVSYDHPFVAPFEHTLNIDFVNGEAGVNGRIALELSTDAARALVETIQTVLAKAEAGNHIVD